MLGQQDNVCPSLWVTKRSQCTLRARVTSQLPWWGAGGGEGCGSMCQGRTLEAIVCGAYVHAQHPRCLQCSTHATPPNRGGRTTAQQRSSSCTHRYLVTDDGAAHLPKHTATATTISRIRGETILRVSLYTENNAAASRSSFAHLLHVAMEHLVGVAIVEQLLEEVTALFLAVDEYERLPWVFSGGELA